MKTPILLSVALAASASAVTIDSQTRSVSVSNETICDGLETDFAAAQDFDSFVESLGESGFCPGTQASVGASQISSLDPNLFTFELVTSRGGFSTADIIQSCDSTFIIEFTLTEQAAWALSADILVGDGLASISLVLPGEFDHSQTGTDVDAFIGSTGLISAGTHTFTAIAEILENEPALTVDFVDSIIDGTLRFGIPGDLDGDGDVDGIDLGILLGNWSIPTGSPGCGGQLPCLSDINGDGVVDGFDLGILLSNWTL